MANQIVVPSLKSPVTEQENAALARWDTSVRKHFTAFELELAGLR